jgi:glycosyltransferase involved in cell wall biosynthesis
VASLAAAIVRLLADRELALRLGQAARSRVVAGFSTTVRGQRLESLFDEAVTQLGL